VTVVAVMDETKECSEECSEECSAVQDEGAASQVENKAPLPAVGAKR
jgi:hypothetical protein